MEVSFSYILKTHKLINSLSKTVAKIQFVAYLPPFALPPLHLFKLGALPCRHRRRHKDHRNGRPNHRRTRRSGHDDSHKDRQSRSVAGPDRTVPTTPAAAAPEDHARGAAVASRPGANLFTARP